MDFNLTKNASENTDKLKKSLFVVDDELDSLLDMKSFYKISNQNRARRTSYNTYFTPFQQQINETRVKELFSKSYIPSFSRESLFAYDSSERFKALTKSKNRLNFDERNRIANKNSNFKKENNNFSINSLESLQKRNNLLINSLKKNYDFFK